MICENILDTIIRITANHEEKQNNHLLKSIVPSTFGSGLIVIDWYQSEAIAVNSFIYKLCKKAFMTSEEQLLILKPLVSSKYSNKILIFDGLNAFNLIKFASFLDLSYLNRILIVNEVDPLRLLVSIINLLPKQLALNCELCLIIIYCDGIFISDLMKFLVKFKLRLNVILVTYNCPNIYRKGYFNGEIQDISFLKINETNEGITIQKTFIKQGIQTENTYRLTMKKF